MSQTVEMTRNGLPPKVMGAGVQETDPVSGAVTSFAGTMAATTIYSRVVVLDRADDVSFDVGWTGTATGQWYVEVSDTYDKRLAAGRWHELSGISPALPAAGGAAGSFFCSIEKCGARFVRLKFVGTGGAGQAEATAYAKGA